MVNCTALVGTWEWIWNGKFRGKGRNSTKYGYYMLLIIAAARRTRPSQWTWSFNCPLSSNQHWEHGWRTSPGSRYLRTVDIHYHSTKHEVKSQFWIPRSGSVLLYICTLEIIKNLWYSNGTIHEKKVKIDKCPNYYQISLIAANSISTHKCLIAAAKSELTFLLYIDPFFILFPFYSERLISLFSDNIGN